MPAPQKKSSNKNLHNANKAKNDEFYTQLSDIERELSHYKERFRDKVIFCNCDDPEESNFFRYFALNFDRLQLRRLIATHYDAEKPTYKLEIDRSIDVNQDNKLDLRDVVRTPLEQNGDFRSPECVELLKQSDIICTNPPFSLFREYIAQLFEYGKKFVIIGNQNAITYKEVFKLIKSNQIWMWYTMPKEFLQSDRTIKKFGNICWFTNLEIQKRHEDLVIYKTYYGNEIVYPRYDNYNAINIDKIKDMPKDYVGAMGVPITFLDKHNPEQFEIVGIDRVLVEEATGKQSRFRIDGKEIYARIIIRNKKL